MKAEVMSSQFGTHSIITLHPENAYEELTLKMMGLGMHNSAKMLTEPPSPVYSSTNLKQVLRREHGRTYGRT